MLGVPPARLDQDDRHAAAGGVLQRRRRRHRCAHRACGIHGDRRLFGLPAPRGADRAHRGGVVVRRDHRVDLVLGIDHRVRQAAGDHLRLADRPRQGPAAGQPAAVGRGDRGRGGRRPARPSRHRRGVAVVDDRPAGRGRGAGSDGGVADRRRRHAGGHLTAQRDDRVVGRGGGFGVEQHRDDRGGHDRRCVRFDPDQPDGQGDEPFHPGDRRRRFRRRWRGPQRRRRRRQARQVHLGRRCRDSDGLRQPGDRGAGLRPGRRAGPACRQGHGRPAGRQGRAGEVRHPPGRRAGCPGT